MQCCVPHETPPIALLLPEAFVLPATVDAKALKILKDTYWTSKGWRDKPVTAPADFAYAKAHRLMFDPIKITHDAAVKTARAAAAKLKPRDVANGFLASLSSGRLDLRSALGTYAIGRHLPAHKLKTERDWPGCAICGSDVGGKWPEDLSVLNFERFRWGGVRHDDPVYIGFDLQRFAERELPPYTKEDEAIMREVLKFADSQPPKTRPSQLAKEIKVVPGSIEQRKKLVEILGFAGILQSAKHTGYFTAFTPLIDCEETAGEWNYPVCWWRGSDGVNWDAVKFWFPKL